MAKNKFNCPKKGWCTFAAELNEIVQAHDGGPFAMHLRKSFLGASYVSLPDIENFSVLLATMFAW